MEKKYKILIVDDSEINRSLLSDILKADYDIVEASDGMEAISVLEKRDDDILLVLLDIIMPKMSGFDVLAKMGKAGWLEHIPVITISAESSSEYIDRAYELGATEYISRPFDEQTVRRRVKNSIMLAAKQKMLENMITEHIVKKEKDNRVMVKILSNIVEFRNGESGAHVLNIITLTDILLRRLIGITDKYNLGGADIALIATASALHDIGKISIPDSIINKPAKLTQEEFEIVKTHSAIGARFLENTPNYGSEKLISTARDICRWHHERWDGKGYPDGLSGDNIPISAQSVGLADVYDALTSERVYKPAFSHDKAIAMILGGECGAFNPLLLDVLVKASPYIETEMKIHEAERISNTEVEQVTDEIISAGGVSDRTLSLLEQERAKYRFYASMSNEILFEYNYKTDMLLLSDVGVSVGLPELINDPLNSDILHETISVTDILDFRSKIRTADPEFPVVIANYRMALGSKRRWYKIVARPLWNLDGGSMVGRIIGKIIDINSEYESMKRLRRKAETDSLTKLLNHEAARERIETIMHGHKRKKYALCILDIDYFKTINDQMGHMYGDEVLIELAKRLRFVTSDGGVAARVGGDEFVIFIPRVGNFVEKTEDNLKILQALFNGKSISVSMGVALYPENGVAYNQLLMCADQALYTVKKSTKRGYAFYDPLMNGVLTNITPIDKET